MMKFRDFSIRHKLILIIMSISTAVLLLASVSFIWYEVKMSRHTMVNELTILVEIIGNNSTAALTFDDAFAAEEILSALKYKEHIVAAFIFKPNNILFATYIRQKSEYKLPQELSTYKTYFKDEFLYITHPIVLEGEDIGKVFLQYDLLEMRARLKQYAGIVFVVFLLSFLFIYLTTSALQRIISKPILNLVGIAKNVSEEKDYSLRAKKESNDELGLLIDGFNEMLSEIQARDQALIKDQAELEKRVRERTKKLQKQIVERKRAEKEKEKAQAELLQAQKMEAIGILAGGIAHDFNNLLTAIQGCADVAMLELDKSDIIYRDLQEIQSASGRAADLTRQLLLFGRKQPLKYDVIDLNLHIENLLKIFHRLIGEDIGISIDFEPNLWNVNADRGSMEQVVMNLVVNARDAMPEGGKLTLKTENIVLDKPAAQMIPEAKPGEFVCFSVSDTGIGMDMETSRHIFEPFFTTKGIGKGTGLGLSVIYGIIKQHNGWIHVYSEPGQGSIFKVYLPAVINREKQSDIEKAGKKFPKGNGERILIVEDEEMVRSFTRKALAKNGYKVSAAANVNEAKRIFTSKKGDFELLFSDVVLPDGNGIELVDQIILEKPQIKILLASGYTDKKSQWPLIKKRGFEFLQKPYDLGGLLRTLKEVLDTGTSGREVAKK